VPLAKPKAESLELMIATLAGAEGEDVLVEAVEDEFVEDVGCELGALIEGMAELVKTLAVGDGPSA